MLTDSGVATTQPSHAEHPVTRPVADLTRFAWQLPTSAMGAALVSLGLQWCVTRLRIPPGSHVPTALLSLTSAVLLASLLGLAALRRWRGWCSALAWTALAALGTLPLAFLLQGTRFYLFGLSGDQFFRTQYLGRLADSPVLADGNYAGLPPYYPAGWFWAGARFANLLGSPAWAAYKPWAITTMAVAPVLSFVLWTAIVRRPLALLLAALTALVGLRVAAYEPYSWLLVAVLVPISIIVHRQWRAHRTEPPRFGWDASVLAGLCLGTCVAVYTLMAYFFAAVLIALATANVITDRSIPPEQPTTGTRAPLRDSVWCACARLLVTAAVAMPIGLPVWAPYLRRAVTTPHETNPAGHFLPLVGAVLPTPMMELSVSGLLCATGTVWILWSWRRNEIAQVLGLLVAGCYLWYVSSTLALSVGTTLLAFRAEPILQTSLACAGALGAWEFCQWCAAARQQHRTAIARIACVLSLLAMLALTHAMPAALEAVTFPGLFAQAHATYDDTGHRADGGTDRNDGQAWNGELLATLDHLTGRARRDTVLLTSETHLLDFRPYRGFQTTLNTHANPLAGYDQRLVLVESWARSPGPKEMLSALDHSPFAPPTAFVLSRQPDGLHTTLSRDEFPSTVSYDVVFPESLFAAPEFVRRDVGPYAVIARR